MENEYELDVWQMIQQSDVVYGDVRRFMPPASKSDTGVQSPSMRCPAIYTE